MSQDADRQAMVQLVAQRGVRDPAVLAAMGAVPRHQFVDPDMQRWAYADRPVPIGNGQTISQPYIVAFMSEALQLRPGDRVLEVGTGCGYQAAVLAHMGAQVFSMEIVPALAHATRRRLAQLGVAGVNTRVGDAAAGWPEEAPFDGIVVTAAPPRVPQALIAQLTPHGRLVIPVGVARQRLKIYRREAGSTHVETAFDVRFVPMVGAVLTQDRRLP